MSEADSNTQTMVEDLILTDAFLVKGRVESKFARLSKVLNQYKKQFLVLSSAKMVDLRRGEVIETPRVHINMREIVMAHEFVDPAGDYFQAKLSAGSEETKPVKIRAFYHGSTNLEIAGRIRPGAYENEGLDGAGAFFVMDDVTLRGLESTVSEDFANLHHLAVRDHQQERARLPLRLQLMSSLPESHPLPEGPPGRPAHPRPRAARRGERTWQEAWTRDLSSGGMLLSWEKAPMAGKHVDIEMRLEGMAAPLKPHGSRASPAWGSRVAGRCSLPRRDQLPGAPRRGPRRATAARDASS